MTPKRGRGKKAGGNGNVVENGKEMLRQRARSSLERRRERDTVAGREEPEVLGTG